MDDYSWMYRDSFKELYMQDYLQVVGDYINFILSIP
jgi:phosphosulfolactate synthase (CoM biosynthesis protein A)